MVNNMWMGVLKIGREQHWHKQVDEIMSDKVPRKANKIHDELYSVQTKPIKNKVRVGQYMPAVREIGQYLSMNPNKYTKVRRYEWVMK